MEKAKSLLKFYFKYLFTKTGLEWTSDNDAEIDDIVDDIYADAEEAAEYKLRQYGVIK